MQLQFNWRSEVNANRLEDLGPHEEMYNAMSKGNVYGRSVALHVEVYNSSPISELLRYTERRPYSSQAKFLLTRYESFV